jgi:PAS domain S-box-containing protein
MSALNILHVEDSPHDAELVEATLRADGLAVRIARVDSRDAYERALAGDAFDVILADYNLPGFDGIAAQMIAQQLCPDTPFIFLSGSIGEEHAIARVKAGATDYVLKDRMARLPSALRRALAETAERLERRRAEADVRRLNAELEQRVVERTAALAESERRLRAILDHSPAMISLKDTAGRYIVSNREFELVAALPPEAIRGRTDEELFPPRLADVYRANDSQVMERKRALEIEETFLRADGARVFHSVKFPLLDDEARPYALCAIAIDITERKKTDDALKIARLEAERANRAKSDFLSRMSHDLRTPLNAILGFAQLLELESLSEDANESVMQIQRGGQHLLSLINEVLDIARIEAGHLSLSHEPVSATEIVDLTLELVAPLAAQRRVSLSARAGRHREDLMVVADRQRLTQVLLNLLANAVKYNRPDGSVSVGFEPVDDGKRLRISVTDTGAGIAPSKLALLFQPFERLGAEQTDVEGTGLGLALSRRLAEAMGGTLGVNSEVDRGSTFWIELALTDHVEARPPSNSSDAVATPAPAPNTTGVVLYIEDNRSNVRLMERVLQRRPGVRLVHAERGDLGLKMAKTQHPDLIFLDLHLPDMSGEEVLRRLWEDAALRRIPVAVLSADATPSQTRRLKASGAIEYLTKPLEIAQVMRVVDHSLADAAYP